MKSKYFVQVRTDLSVQVSKRSFEQYLIHSVNHRDISCYYSNDVLYHHLLRIV